MKKLLISIAIVIIIIICIIVCIILKNNEKPKIEESTYDQTIEEVEKETVTEQEDRELIYNVEQCISSYLDIINVNNSSYYMNDENGNSQKFVNEDEKILNVLSTEYIAKNNITMNNLNNYIEKLDKDVFFIPLQTNYLKNGYMYKYAVLGYITDFDYNVIKNISLIVNLDITNLTYSVEPVDIEINNIKDIELTSTLDSIEKNDDNVFRYISTNAEDDCKRFLDNYKKMALSNPEEAYNRLNEEYRNLRFGNLETYEKYIEENRDDMKVMQLNQYMVSDENGKTQYICKDKYGKVYVFEGENLMNLSIQLDTYTIETSSFKEQYENGDAQQKVQMDIYKFILMINNQDFQRAYDLLDENFKNNYFITIDDFIKYVKSAAYKYNDMKATSFDVTGNIYSCGVELTDSTGGLLIDTTKGEGGSGYILNWNFYVQLGEDKDFKISFNVDTNIL